MTPTELKQEARLVFRKLKRMHPDAHCELEYKNPLQLMVATILSAQCTDVMVNRVTKELFKNYKIADDYANASINKLEHAIRSIGLFRAKAKNIKAAAKIIADEHAGKVPQTLAELIKLPGVGRKTANVILGNAFSIPGLPVDTHVRRVTNRIGLVVSDDPVEIEHQLNAMLNKKDWTLFSHTVIFHGRRICLARKPRCEECSVNTVCDYYNQR